jgi:hypothetical protein
MRSVSFEAAGQPQPRGLKKEVATMAEEKKRKCAHPACDCLVDKNTKYCSQYCKDAAGTMEISCNCRHAQCGTQAATTGA